MPPRPNEASGASTALAVVGLTTQIAVAATDGIPIVKQVLAVAARIITLVEDIEKRRDALHGLAETARTLVQSIEAVVSDRELGEEVARRLVALHSVLQTIEALLEKHRAKKPLRKALSYAFTISRRIDNLNQELSRAIQGFQLVAAVDTNAQVREDPHYIGEFRRIRHCDVEDLKLIEEHPVYWTEYTSKIYTTKVGGSVCILRCFARKSEVGRDGKSDWEEWHRRRVIEHDQLLQKLSTVQNLHPNVARLYGRSSGEDFDRFNVMNLGFIPISEAPQCTATVDGTWNVVRQIRDALCHLHERGATWLPPRNSIFVDGTGAPIIGLHNDLRSFGDWWYWPQIQVLRMLLEHGLKASWLESHLDADEHHPFAICIGDRIRANSFRITCCSIPRRLIPSLDEKTSRYLQNAHATYKDDLVLWTETGSVLLRAAASGRTVGPEFVTVYWAPAGPEDHIDMYRVEERGDELIYLRTSIVVPFHMKDVYRKTLGITLPDAASDGELFVSNCNPAEPSSMSFRWHH